LGKQSSGRYGLQVKNATGGEVLRVGELPSSKYGMEALDPATGNTVQRLENGLLSIFDASAVTRVKVGKDGTDYDVKVLDSAGANAVALSTLAYGIKAAADSGTVSTTSTGTWQDLGGPSVTVTVGPSGRMLVFPAAAANATQGSNQFAGFDISGATSVSPDVSKASMVGTALHAAGENNQHAATTAILVTGLNAGSHDVEMRYYSATSVGSFYYRTLVVIPF
jgi:hypothetical protein